MPEFAPLHGDERRGAAVDGLAARSVERRPRVDPERDARRDLERPGDERVVRAAGRQLDRLARGAGVERRLDGRGVEAGLAGNASRGHALRGLERRAGRGDRRLRRQVRVAGAARSRSRPAAVGSASTVDSASASRVVASAARVAFVAAASARTAAAAAAGAATCARPARTSATRAAAARAATARRRAHVTTPRLRLGAARDHGYRGDQAGDDPDDGRTTDDAHAWSCSREANRSPKYDRGRWCFSEGGQLCRECVHPAESVRAARPASTGRPAAAPEAPASATPAEAAAPSAPPTEPPSSAPAAAPAPAATAGA